MVRRKRRRSRLNPWRRAISLAAATVLALPLLYLLAALIGSLIPLNADWDEPEEGITIYLASNGIHSDIVMPVRAGGLDWEPLLSRGHVRRPNPAARWIAFGSGERRVYLDTPRWRDISLRTIASALGGGERLMHVSWTITPRYAERAIRLRPEEYRRLWAAIRNDFQRGADGWVQRVDHPGYGPTDTFYKATGKADMILTCNSWTANRLRIAGVETSLWPPFVQGLLWRYRRNHST